MQSETSCNFEKAKDLTTYIVDKYGPEQLGLLKLLAAFQPFRQASESGEYRKLVGYNQMLSFEKVLRETKGEYYGRSTSASGTWFTHTSKDGERRYRDDFFGTVARTVVAQIATLHPDLSAFKRGPVVQLGHGVDVDAALDTIELESVEKLLTQLGPSHADTLEQFNNITAAVVEGEDKLAKYRLFELVSDLFTDLRMQELDYGDLQGEEASMATSAEKFDVLEGKLRKSIPFDAPPSASMKAALEEAHPQGIWRDNNFILLEPYDPFKLIGSSRAALEPLDGGKRTPVEPTTVHIEETGGAGGCRDAVDEAIFMVDKYVSVDINTLSPTERVKCMFGSKEGELLWEKKISAIKKRMVLKEMPRDPLTPRAWITSMSTILGRFIGGGTAGDPNIQETIIFLAAGRTLAYKAQVEFCANTWQKK